MWIKYIYIDWKRLYSMASTPRLDIQLYRFLTRSLVKTILSYSPCAKVLENILPVIFGNNKNVIRMTNFLSHFFLAEMTSKEFLAFFESGAQGVFMNNIIISHMCFNIKKHVCTIFRQTLGDRIFCYLN